MTGSSSSGFIRPATARKNRSRSRSSIKDHPVTKPLENWTTINEELYNNIKLFETAKPLARGRQDTGKKVDDFVVTWTNTYGKAKRLQHDHRP